jgi:hypothetical protein
MSEYTPTTGEVRGWYLGLGIAGRAELSSECANEFDRWLASVKADVWDECAQEAYALGWLHESSLFDLENRNTYRGVDDE